MLISREKLLRLYINNLVLEGFTPQNPSISFVDSSKFISPIYNKICKEILPIILKELYNRYPNINHFIFKSFNNKYNINQQNLLDALSDPTFISSISSKLPDLNNFININDMITPDNIRLIDLINNNLNLRRFQILPSDKPFNLNIYFCVNKNGFWVNNTNINMPKDLFAGFFQLIGYNQNGIDSLITFNLFHLIYHTIFVYYVGVIKNNDTWDNVFNKFVNDFVKIDLLKVIRHELEHAFQIINNLLNKIKNRIINYINPYLKKKRNKERKQRLKDKIAGKIIVKPVKLDIISFLKDSNTPRQHFINITREILQILKDSPVIAVEYSRQKRRKGYGFTKTNPNILRYSNQKYINQNNNIIKNRESRLYRYDPVEIIPQMNDLVMGYVFAAAGIFNNVESAINWFFEFIESDLFKEKYALKKIQI